MCNLEEKIRGFLEPELGISVDKGHAVDVHHQHLFNCPWVDDVMSQSLYKVQPPCAGNVVHKDEVLLRELLET